MTKKVVKELENMCNHCQYMLDKPCAWLSLGNEYCDEIMNIQKKIDNLKKHNEKLNKEAQKYFDLLMECEYKEE